MALLPPLFLDCVTAIGAEESNAQHSFFATGFLYGRLSKDVKPPNEPTYWIYLVTNRHVFEGRSEVVLRFNPSTGEPAKLYRLPLVSTNGEVVWCKHPHPEVDAAAIEINVGKLKEEGIEFHFFSSDQHVMTKQIAESEGLAEGDNIFVLGFPLGDVGENRSYAIVRHGVIARVRDYLADQSEWILVDATVFPGNSGGPVVSRPEAMAITGTTSTSTARLLGMVSSYIPYNDVAYSMQTNRPRVMFEENTGITRIVPFSHVAETVEVAYRRQFPE